GLMLDHLGLAVADRDLARLLGLGDFTDQVDVQETVLQRSALDLDEVGELEDALEGTRRDPLIKGFALVLVGRLLLLAADSQRVLLDLDRQLILAEAGRGYRDAVVVLASTLDVVGRVAGGRGVNAANAVEQREQPIETDGRTIEG